MTEPTLPDTNKQAFFRRAFHGARVGLRHRWVWFAIVVVLAAAIAWWVGWPRSAESPAAARGDMRNRPMPVIAAPATKGSVDVYLNALGTATPRNVVIVRSRVDGQLNKVNFREGQYVKAGMLLAEIDPRPFEVQLAQAAGQLARDEALLRNAQRDLERYNTLFAQDSISRQQRDTQESLVHQYQGAVESDRAQVDNAKLQLSYCRIVSPIDGRVGLRQVDPGNMVRAADTNGIVVVTQLQPITVLFTLPEDNVPAVMKRLQSGQVVPVEAYDRDQKMKLATGKLMAIDNQVDTTTGTVRLRGEFPNIDNALFPNQFVNVRLLVDTLRDTVSVPTAAVQRGSQGVFVFVVKDDQTVTVRVIKPGPVQSEKTAVLDGVAPGELVVVDGVDKLREGARIQLTSNEERNPKRSADTASSASPPNSANDGPPRGERGRRRTGKPQP